MRDSDVITLPRLLSRLPMVAANLPGLIKGARMSKITDTRKPVGLAMGFQQAVSRNPDGVAVLHENQQLTYRSLNTWANRIAHYFAARGLRKGDTVALGIENRPELLATVLGCAKLGVCVALLNTAQRGAVLVHSINLVMPKAVIVGEEMREAVEGVRTELVVERAHFFYWADGAGDLHPHNVPEGYLDLADEIQGCASHDPDTVSQIFLKDPLFYIYTSGTTGLPKAVIFNNGRWWKAYGGFGYSAVRLKHNDRMYCSLPFYHATGMVVCWSSVICAGATLVLVRRFSATRFWEDVRRYRCTSFGYVGELCRYLHEAPARPDDRDNAVHVIVGNGLRPSIWKPFRERFGIDRVVEFYASSEGNVAFTNVFGFDNTVGFSPVAYAIVKYDKETEQPLRGGNGLMIRADKGEAGLMLGEISPKTPFDGYTDKTKTEASIFRNVFRKGDAWFNTGDMMRDIGFRHAQFVDRLGDTFRWKGENVSTTEVEQIMDAHEGVIETVVYGVEIPGTNGRAGMAQLRLHCGHEDFDFSSLAVHLRQQLPAYAVPVFLRISDAAIETTGTFKHQKNTLKEQKYDLMQQDNPVYVILPGEPRYQLLTPETQREIDAGQYRV